MKAFSEAYTTYMASDAWRRRRALKLLLAGALTGKVQCESCKLMLHPGRIDAHHVTYERFGEERMEDLRLLCRPCHEAVKEIEAIAAGGGVDDMSDGLKQMLAMIDRRLETSLTITEVAIPSPPKPHRDYAEVSIGGLLESIRAKRESFGISV